MTLRYSGDSLRDLLLKSLQRKSLEEQPDASEWVRDLVIAFRADLGLLALHGRSGLSEQLPEQPLIRIPLCGADNLILLLARDAIQSRRHLGIAVPPGAVMIPLLIVCKILLGDLLDQQENLASTNRPLGIKEKGGILLVSPDPEMRTRYFSMRVGSENVITSYPACRMRPDGSVVAISGKQLMTDGFSVCFFLAHQKHLPNPPDSEFTPTVVILDLTHDHWIERMAEVIEWCIQLRDAQGEQATLLIILPFGDKRSREALNGHSIPIFPLDSAGILEIVEGFSPIVIPKDEHTREAYRTWSFSSFAIEKPLERKHTIYYVPYDAAASVLETITHIYQALNDTNEQYVHRDLRLAGWLVGTLIQLPIPIQWYEQHAYLMGNRQTLKKLISSIGNNSSSALHLDIAPVLQTLRGQLDLLYMRLSVTNPKSEAFLQYYKERLQPFLAEAKKNVLLARNDVVARAMWPWLLSEGISAEQQPNLRMLTYKQIDGRETFDHMIATGPWPSRYRWQIGGRLGSTVDFLLYQGEEDILEQQMRSFYGTQAQSFFERTRLSLLRTFGNLDASVQSNNQQTNRSSLHLTTINGGERLHQYLQQETAFNLHPDEIETDLKPLFNIVSLDPANPTSTSFPGESDQVHVLHWHEHSFHDSGDQPEGDADDELLLTSSLTESCLLLKVRLMNINTDVNPIQYLYLNSEGVTECYMPGQNDELSQVANDEIEPGFVLIRTDQGDRQSLFERIVQLADAQPTMKYLKEWRDYWLEAVDSLVQKHASGKAKRGTYQQLQKQLVNSGVKVTNATVRGWVLGERIGPGNIASIKAIGMLSQHPMVQKYPQQVDAAFRQIRTIHQVLGRRISMKLQDLNKVALHIPHKQHQVSKGTKREMQLDPALSVPIDDLLDLLQFWEIVEIDQGPWNVPIHQIGLVLQKVIGKGHE